ncbi:MULTISPECIES: PRC-barrel domain-containing protein [Caloramator]|uniref:Uncharacterized protein YrrD, contains PRC-barrel domain n=1 Tax=Caloramator proteoclasticus DSM 10124 TaxID=1121262 RepID=A0A1M4VD83_9CLOT|nr:MULTISPECIES: PRC-barrel domain-containing protein [Caloramator]SHE66780.1 Uncharacterized protein YrrD, contains PRC-barrel domain [Caloramator proteoclasticus DSM 10124]
MKRLTDILNKKVVTYSGEDLGKIIDVLFDCRKLNVTGYIISKRRGILSRYYFVTPKQINIVSDVIIISNLDKNLSKIKYKVIRKLSLAERLGNSVFSKNTSYLGSLKDIIFDEYTGEIKALCVTNGILNDLINGRNIILVDKDTKFKSKFIIVNDDIRILNKASINKILR